MKRIRIAFGIPSFIYPDSKFYDIQCCELGSVIRLRNVERTTKIRGLGYTTTGYYFMYVKHKETMEYLIRLTQNLAEEEGLMVHRYEEE